SSASGSRRRRCRGPPTVPAGSSAPTTARRPTTSRRSPRRPSATCRRAATTRTGCTSPARSAPPPRFDGNDNQERPAMTTTIWSGLAVGAVYALVAIGYNVVLLASGVFNFAHAQLIMLGTFMAFVGAGSLGLPVLLVIPFAAAVVAAVAIAEERVAIRPLMTGRRDAHATLITSVGAAVVL